MALFTTPLVTVLLAVACIVHPVPFILKGIWGKTVAIANIALHIAMFLTLVLMRIDIEDTVLAFMISTFGYMLTYFVFYRIRRRDG